MKPLAVSLLPRPPHSSRDGLAIRNHALLTALTREFRVRAFALSDPERAYEGEWPAGVEAEVVPQPPRRLRRAVAAVASLTAGGAYSERLYRSAELVRRAGRASAGTAGDAARWIIAHSYHVAPSALAAGGRVWIDFHNLDSEIWRRTSETAHSPLVRGFAELQAWRVRALERRLARAAAGVSCVSGRDAAEIRILGGEAEPLVVPNGVDLSRHAFRAADPGGETVLFIGDLSWPPNADGVRWLLTRVWPRVRELRPAARLKIVGRAAPPDIARAAGTDVTIAGEGGDSRAAWREAAVAAVPLLSGGGTRLKILEAAAAGVPVVSTSVGAEGLSFVDETEILRRDEPEEFARSIAALLSGRDAARRQAGQARARVEQEYGWGPIGEAFVRALAGTRPDA
jgi:glycosyltransferase involved in cell wall biosynthesis